MRIPANALSRALVGCLTACAYALHQRGLLRAERRALGELNEELLCEARLHGQSAVCAGPEVGSRAFSGRAWQLWLARRSQCEASPLGAQPLLPGLEVAACKAADFAAFDPPRPGCWRSN